VVATTADGILVRFSAPYPGMLGVRSCAAPRPRSLDTERLAMLPVLPIGRAVAAEPRCLGDLVPGAKALLIHAHHSGYADPRPQFRPLLEQAGFTIEQGHGVPADYLKMQDASIIIINAHGGTTDIGGTKHFFIGSDFDEDLNVSDLTEWFLWLKRNEMAIERTIDRDETTKRPKRVVYGVDIFDTWLDNNLDSMVSNSFVLLMTCHGADLDTPWSIFKTKGASAFFGFENTTDNTWSATWVKELLERTLGQSEERPDETAPRLRAQCVEDAFDAIYAKPGYPLGPDWNQWYPGKGYKRAIPVIRTFWQGACCNFSVSPHIDWAQIGRIEDSDDYEVALWGAFGLAEEAEVLLNEQPLEFTTHTGGGGAVFEVTVPNNMTGDLVVVDKWGRRSNLVTVSRFEATVEIDYDGPMCSGAMKLHHSELVVGARLYRGLSTDLIYAGWPAFRIREMSDYWEQRIPWMVSVPPIEETRPYPLVCAQGDWELQWRFNSVRDLGGGVQIVVRGDGTGQGRGTDEDDPEAEMEPYASVMVNLNPSFGPWDTRVCDAEVTVFACVPLTIVVPGMEAPYGVVATGPAATVRYDQKEGVVPRVEAEGQWCRWRMEQVVLEPDPYDPEKRM